MYWNQKKIQFFFYYPSQNFALWQKIAVTQNFYPNFFYSLDPPLSEFKVKIRGNPFAYSCYSSNRTTLLPDGKYLTHGEATSRRERYNDDDKVIEREKLLPTIPMGILAIPLWILFRSSNLLIFFQN